MLSKNLCLRSALLVWAVGAAVACASEAPKKMTGGISGGTGGGGAGGLGGAGGSVTGGVGGGVAGAAGMAGMSGGTGVTGGVGGAPAGGVGGATGGVGGATGGVGGVDGDAGMMMPDAGGDGDGDGDCCPDGDCICRPEAPPTSLEGATADGPYNYESYDNGTGCIYYPTDAEPPFSAVAISDGFGGSGGCGAFAQTSGWGPYYASHGIVAMIVNTTGGDQPRTRGTKLGNGIASFKDENMDSGSPIYQKLAGRYGTSGFSMGGGGTTFAAADDPTLMTSVGLMAWTPTGSGVTVPTLFICGTSDGLATCGGHSEPAFNAMPDTTPKGLVWVSSSHVGQPSAGGGMQGAHGLAFQKVYLDGDERWRPVLEMAEFDPGSNIVQ
jgi:hypothetical protein